MQPNLPRVDELAHKLAQRIGTTPASRGSVWYVPGPPTAGKSALLAALEQRLVGGGLAVHVSPPVGKPDAGPVALLQIAGALKNGGLTNGEAETLLEPSRPWSDKISTVRGWLANGYRQDVVLLCDEPALWAKGATEDDHFAGRARDVAHLLVDGNECRRVVTGHMPDGPRGTVTSLSPQSAPGPWLRDDSTWGELAGTAQALQESAGSTLEQYSPLEIRLFVALGRLRSIEYVLGLIAENISRRSISRHLATELDAHPELRPLSTVWGRLALVRRAFDSDAEEVLGAADLDGLARNILDRCLLYGNDGNRALHETLRVDAGAHNWLTRAEEQRTHACLVDYYAQRFEGVSTRDRWKSCLLEETEAFHHATSAADAQCLERFGPFFVEQLDALGKSVSVAAHPSDTSGFKAAAEIFEKSIAWADDNDYAHHYLAYNLDVLGLEPDRVEEHYERAVELRPSSSWWHSRYVNFLITMGRTADARRAWDDALDSLGLPDSSAESGVYEHLHLWVARLLLHRGQLDFARTVLGGIPKRVRDLHGGLRATQRRLEALLEAQRTGAFVPGPNLTSDWWRQGPFLLHPLSEGSLPLVKWMAARVDGSTDGELHLRVAELQVEGDEPPSLGRTSVTFAQFDSWKPDRRAATIEPGDFIEIGTYAAKRKRALVRARVHKRQPWLDEDLPRTWPNPRRYLAHGL